MFQVCVLSTRPRLQKHTYVRTNVYVTYDADRVAHVRAYAQVYMCVSYIVYVVYILARATYTLRQDMIIS